MRSRGLLVAFVMLVGAVGCAASLEHPPDAPPPGSSVDAGVTGDAPATAEPEMVTCPPGLPISFDIGLATTTKNGPGSPAMYDSYNVFDDLGDNPRWFFAMNLYENRGVFAGGFDLNKPYAIAGPDTAYPTCALCINLFADKDTTPGGPSLHMFPSSGTLTITAKSTDRTRVSGKLQDIKLDAIKIVYDQDSIACTDDAECGNSICLNKRCGRQVPLVGCVTAIKNMTF